MTSRKKPTTLKDKNFSTSARIALTILSGLLCIASFPRTGLFPFAWVALVPLFFAVSKTSTKQSFFLGWLYGVIHALGIAYWVFYALYVNSHAGFYVSLLFLLIVVGGFMGLYLALFTLGVNRLVKHRASSFLKTLAVPCLWVVIEFCRSHLFSGMPWTLLGHSQYSWTRLIQITDLTGVYGLSFVIVLVNYGIYSGYSSLPNIRASLCCLLPPLIIVGILLVYGSIRLSQFTTPISQLNFTETSSDAHTIAVVQGSILQHERWKKENFEKNIATHLHLSEEALKKGARLIIWPETTIPYYLQHKIPSRLLDMLNRYNATLITGGPRFIGSPGRYTFFNSAFYLTREGIIKTHDKIHLFPFNEYFPLGFIDILKTQYAGPREYSPGKNFVVFSTPAGCLGTLICFEVIFPALAREFVKEGADFLVNISNDAWFGKTSAHYQHFSMAVFRAVECRRPLMRAANTGISGFIDPSGKIIESLAPFKEGILLHQPTFCNRMTFYVRYGDLFAGLCFLGLLCVFSPRWKIPLHARRGRKGIKKRVLR